MQRVIMLLDATIMAVVAKLQKAFQLRQVRFSTKRFPCSPRPWFLVHHGLKEFALLSLRGPSPNTGHVSAVGGSGGRETEEGKHHPRPVTWTGHAIVLLPKVHPETH